MPKSKPQRTCIGCRQVTFKRQLIRIVRTTAGEAVVDPTGKQAGRGAYLCANRGCWERALAHSQLNRALKMTLSDETIARLRAFAEGLPDLDSEIKSREA